MLAVVGIARRAQAAADRAGARALTSIQMGAGLCR
jgi:hypothetical protein